MAMELGLCLEPSEKDAIFLRSAVAKFSAPQKNWMPFEYGKCLFLEYSIQPHVILSLIWIPQSVLKLIARPWSPVLSQTIFMGVRHH